MTLKLLIKLNALSNLIIILTEDYKKYVTTVSETPYSRILLLILFEFNKYYIQKSFI